MEVGNMIEHKRSGPCSNIDENSLMSFTPKRHKPRFSISSKESKEKLGQRVVALQELVSPFGKTDTASVLFEAMGYIQFLHEQVKVLSAPYLQSSPKANMQGLEQYSLRSRGLCLVPVSHTAGVTGSNGADIWAPVKTTTTSNKFENKT